MPAYNGPPQREDLIDLGARLRAARLKKGWSMEELAKQSQISASTIKNVEMGRHVASAITVKMLSRALGNDGAEVFQWSEAALQKEAWEAAQAQVAAEHRVLAIATLAALLQQYSLPEQVAALVQAGVDRKAFVVELLQHPEHPVVPDAA